MNKVEMKMVEVTYNLRQAYLKAQKIGDKSLINSLKYLIYSFNSVAKEINQNLLDEDLMKIGQELHNEFLSGRKLPIEGIGKGLDFGENENE